MQTAEKAALNRLLRPVRAADENLTAELRQTNLNLHLALCLYKSQENETVPPAKCSRRTRPADSRAGQAGSSWR